MIRTAKETKSVMLMEDAEQVRRILLILFCIKEKDDERVPLN